MEMFSYNLSLLLQEIVITESNPVIKIISLQKAI